MADPEKVWQLGLGGALALFILREVFNFISRTFRKPDPPEKSGASNGASGEMSIGFWAEQIREIVEHALEQRMKQRNDELRKLIREELAISSGREDLRAIVRDELAQFRKILKGRK
jgi:hypothetical protein